MTWDKCGYTDWCVLRSCAACVQNASESTEATVVSRAQIQRTLKIINIVVNVHDHNAFSMMDDYELEFLIEGDDFTLAVTIPRTANVQRLRRLIYQEGEFDAFRLRDVKLFKV
jgi:hypothetical protein